MAKISDIIKERLDCEQELACLKKLYEEQKKEIEDRIKELSDKEKVVSEGLDLEKIELGKKVLYIHGNPYQRCQDTKSDGSNTLAKLAIADILDGCRHLRKEYFGQKRYEGYHQRSDHSYGYGPSHGSIVEEVGLRNREKELSDEEVEAAVYYLTVWQQLPEANKEK
jgi:hypothetical protein